MNEKKRFGAFSSSVDPSQVSLTVESVIKLIGLVLGGYLSYKGSGMVIDDETIKQVTDAITLVVVSAMSIWQSANLLFGIVRKFIRS